MTAIKEVKKRNQCDEFLHKMKELWDNREDEAWEHFHLGKEKKTHLLQSL